MNWFTKKPKDLAMEPQPAASSIVRVSDSLSEQTILIFRADLPKRNLFAKLIELLHLPEPDIALRSVLAREQIGSTTIELGVALPHARVHGLARIHAALGIIPAGEIKLCLLFVGPTDNMKGHLGFLASSAALLQRKDFRQALIHAGDSRAILEKIQLEERTAPGTAQ
jgi:PTS system nitrogen regulatory IIA component